MTSFNRSAVIGVSGDRSAVLAEVFDGLSQGGKIVKNCYSGTIGVALKKAGWKVINQAWTWTPPSFLIEAAAAKGIGNDELIDLLIASRFVNQPGKCGRAIMDGGHLFDAATRDDLGEVVEV